MKFTLLTLLFTMVVSFAPSAFGRKPYNMTVMNFISMTGNGYKEGKACMAAMNFVLDNVNNRNDILPSYHLIPDYVDEMAGSYNGPKGAVAFSRRMEEMWQQNPGNPRSYQSPVITGLTFTPGCKGLGKFVQHIPSILITGYCLASVYTDNRKTFPNMFRPRMSSELSNYAMVAFIKSNGWNQVGLYANADNQYNTMIASHFYDVAVASGLKLTWYEVASGWSQGLLDSMKQSGIRIIVLQIAELPVVYSFLCLAYNNNIRGPKYVFIFGIGTWSDPNLLPDIVGPNCNKTMILEQFRHTSLIIGSAAVPFTSFGNSTLLQYDLNTFENEFAKYTGWTQQPVDAEERFMCYDRILQAVLALDRAEKKLAAQNMTLLDYHDHPNEVMPIVNQSVIETDFVGLRVGRVKYSKRLEIEDEANVIVTRQTEQGFLNNYRLIRLANSSIEVVSAYSVKPVAPLDWATLNGLPPRDFAIIVTSHAQLSEGLSTTILVIAATSGTAKIAIAMAAWFKSKGGPVILAVYSIVMCSCTCLDAAAAVFMAPLDAGRGRALCLARPFLLAIGITPLATIYFARLHLLRRLMRLNTLSVPHLSVAGTAHSNAVSPAILTNSLRRRSAIKTDHGGGKSLIDLSFAQEVISIAATAIYVLVNIGVLLALAHTDSPDLVRFHVTPVPIYDDLKDTLTTTYIDVCFSEIQNNFYGALFAVDGALLLYACYCAYRLRQAHFDHLLNKISCVAAVNTLTLLAATICILFLVAEKLHAQEVTVAIAAITVSGSVAALMSYGIFIRQSNQQRVTQIPLEHNLPTTQARRASTACRNSAETPQNL